MAVDWNDDGMLMWREEAVKEQQHYFKVFGAPMWREFEASKYNVLKRQIGTALFGVPEEEPHANSNDDIGYRDEKLKQINEIFGIIEKYTTNNTNKNRICASFLHISGKKTDACITIPVIRILHFDEVFKQNVNYFIDSIGRVYKNWQDYLDNNTLPECVLCYPRNGVYSAVKGAVDVELGFSPVGRRGAKILQSCDTAGSVLNVGAAVALTAGTFVPVALPVVAGAVGVSMLTGAYSVGRNIQTLVDRDQHQQSIGLDNAISRNCWFGIGGSAMGIVSGVSMVTAAKIAQAAATVPLAGQITVNVAAYSSCFLNSLAVGNGLFNICIKAANGMEITTLDVFQFITAALFLTNSVISTRQAMSMIESFGKNSSGGSPASTKEFMTRIYEYVKATKACNSVPGVVVGVSTTFAKERFSSFLSVCKVLGRKLVEITSSLLIGRTNMYNFNLEVSEAVRQFRESWNREMAEAIDTISRALGVKHLSEFGIESCRSNDFVHIRQMASTLIARMASLVDCGNTAMPFRQRQAISDNSAVVGTDDGTNILVDGETQTYRSYYDEIANIVAKFADQQMCRNAEDFCKYMTFVCNFVKSRLQEKISVFEKSWETVKHFNPDVNIEDFKKKYGISGIPNSHFLQEMFNEYTKEETSVFSSLHLAYEKQNAGTSAQEVANGHDFINSDGVRFYTFYSMDTLASNGMPSEQQYREMAEKWTGRQGDIYSIFMSDSGDTAVIQVNATAEVIMVQCWPEDGKVSGVAAVLHTPAE